jgi:uncharacterized delta-60 repeat protein
MELKYNNLIRYIAAVLAVFLISGTSLTACTTGKIIFGDEPVEVELSAFAENKAARITWTLLNGYPDYYNLYYTIEPQDNAQADLSFSANETAGTQIGGNLTDTNFKHEGITNGKIYCYWVKGMSADGKTLAVSNFDCVRPMPGTPVLNIETSTLKNVLTWDPWPADVNSWNIYWRINADASYFLPPDITEDEYLIEDVQPPLDHESLSNRGVEYCYRLVPVVSGIEGNSSDTVCGMPDTIGIPDDSLAGTGIITENLGQGHDEFANDIALDSQGRVIVVGYEFNPGVKSYIVLYRYLEDGTPDDAFGINGRVTYDIGNPTEFYDGNAVAIDSKDRILVAGFINDTNVIPWHRTATMWRFLENGIPDPSFGVNGVVKYANPLPYGNYDWFYDIDFDKESRIVLTGIFFNSTLWILDLAIWRYLENGSFDPSFNGGQPVRFNNNVIGDYGFSLYIDDQERYVIGGQSADTLGWGFMHASLYRFLKDGSPDPSFNGGSPLIISRKTAGLSDDLIRTVWVDAEGRILASGTRENASGGEDFTIWRFLDNGSPDFSFGDGTGIIQYDAGTNEEEASAVMTDDRGRIIAAGVISNKMQIHRYMDNGEPDPSFGEGGRVVYEGGFGFDQAASIIEDSLGRIIAAGRTATASADDLALWRYK